MTGLFDLLSWPPSWPPGPATPHEAQGVGSLCLVAQAGVGRAVGTDFDCVQEDPFMPRAVLGFGLFGVASSVFGNGSYSFQKVVAHRLGPPRGH